MIAAARITLACAALVAGALAAIIGNAQPPLANDEITAVDLAVLLRGHKERLLVLDTRPADAFDAEHLPGARRQVMSSAENVGDTVVLYADRDVDSQVAEAMRVQTGTRTLRLRGGMRAWNDEVLFPVVRDDASAQQRQQFEDRAALSRYFGGTPRRLEPGASAGKSRSRRGC
ncbi:MAG: rhodanese-like domain-containing protein [Dokdonella sp.]